jgi:hypothetical protein
MEETNLGVFLPAAPAAQQRKKKRKPLAIFSSRAVREGTARSA